MIVANITSYISSFFVKFLVRINFCCKITVTANTIRRDIYYGHVWIQGLELFLAKNSPKSPNIRASSWLFANILPQKTILLKE